MENRKQDVEIIKDSFIEVALRKDFYEKLKTELNELLKLTGASYFSHSLIKNYYKKDFYVSSFNLNEEWLDLYWKEYWHNDPIERKSYKNAKINGSSMVLWESEDKESVCMKRRKQICGVENGVCFSYHHEDESLEAYAFGWKKNDKEGISSLDLDHIKKVMMPIRDYHRSVFKNHLRETF